MIQFFALIIAGFIFSGCGAGEFLAQYARSDVEKAAEKNLEVSAQKQTLIDRQTQYPLSTQLMPIAGNHSGLLFVYEKTEAEKIIIEAEGYLSRPTTGEWVLWLTNDSQDKFINLGKLSFQSGNRVRLIATGSAEIASMKAVILSLETAAGERPAQPTLAGMLLTFSTR